MKITPLSDRILIRRKKAAEKIGSIIVPENAKGKLNEGEVLAVGPGRLLENGKRQPVFVIPGQVVLFGQFAGAEVKVGEELVVIREDDVLGVVEPE